MSAIVAAGTTHNLIGESYTDTHDQAAVSLLFGMVGESYTDTHDQAAASLLFGIVGESYTDTHDQAAVSLLFGIVGESYTDTHGQAAASMSLSATGESYTDTHGQAAVSMSLSATGESYTESDSVGYASLIMDIGGESYTETDAIGNLTFLVIGGTTHNLLGESYTETDAAALATMSLSATGESYTESDSVGYASLIMDIGGESYTETYAESLLGMSHKLLGESYTQASANGFLSFTTAIYLAQEAVVAGYSYVVGSVGETQPEHLLNPSPLFAALRSGWTFSEAIAVAMPTINSTWRPIGDPLGVVPMPREGFEIRKQPGMELVSVELGDATQVDLGGLLTDGEWDVDIIRQDKYGSSSDPATIRVKIESSAAVTQLVEPARVKSKTQSGGMVQVQWASISDDSLDDSAAFEIAAASDPATILNTITAGSASVFRVSVGPFTHGRTVRLLIRATDGAGTVGPWVDVPPFVSDSQPPPLPEFV